MIANNSLSKLSELLDLGPLTESINVLFGPAAEHIAIVDYFEYEESGVTSHSLVLGVKQSILFNVPAIEAIQLGIISDNPDKWPLILCEIVVSGAAPKISIKHFPLRVVLNNSLLIPLPPDEGEVLNGFSFEVEGSFSVSLDLSLKAELDSFSVPRFAIAGTGLIFSLQNCQLITHSDDVTTEVEALGFDQGFRGLYAASAQFNWEIPFIISGFELPGIRADLDNIALGNQGVSVAASLHWNVILNDNSIDSEHTEIFGELFASNWQCAIEKLDVVIERNIPIGTSGAGFLRIPYFEQIIKVELGYRYQSPNRYELSLALSQMTQEALTINLGSANYQLAFSDFQLSGQVNSDGDFQLQGEVSLSLDLPGLSVVAESVLIKFEHTEQQDNVLIKLDNIQVDDYGQIDAAQLVLVMLKGDDDHYQLALLELISEMQWQDLSNRISLQNSAAVLPMPPDNALVSLNISWSENLVHFNIKAELDGVDNFWRFIPEAMRPEVDNANIDIQLTATNGDFSGELGVEFLLRLPDFANSEVLQNAGLHQFIEVESGNEDGWLQLRFTAELGSENEQSSGAISASIENPILIGLQLPGLLLPEAPIVIDITRISIELSADGSEMAGVLKFDGNFHLYPILPDDLSGYVPPIIAVQLDKLLAIAKQLELFGNASLTLGLSHDNAYFQAECNFDQLAIEIDLFDMLSRVLAGSNNIFGQSQESEIDLDIEVSIQLQDIYVHLGSEQATDNQVIPFTVGFNSLLNFAHVIDFPFEFTLTQESLSFGLSELSIPLAIPKLPLSLDDLNNLKDTNGNWDIANNWEKDLLPALVANITLKRQELDQAQVLLADLLEEPEDNQAQIFQQQYRVIPKIQASLFDFAGRKFLFEAILFVFQNLNGSARNSYQQYMEIYQTAVDSAFGWISFDTQLRFDIQDAQFVLPFNNPSDIRVEGKASIGGVDPSSVFAPLADLAFKLGISADAIFFAVEGGINPIALPDFGRYPGSAVKIDKILIGYGYSKNSLKVDFAGELILADKLVDDADRSNELGLGVRLPSNSQLGFKLDLIPVVLGEVDFVIPLIALDIDLTSEFPPPAPEITEGQCNPAWDGLQVIVPNIIRADLKKYKFSPFFGPLPANNGQFACDLAVGNKELGLQYIADYRIIMPILNSLPVPFLMDSSPFFERLCSNFQIGGFGLSFDLTRPFPHPSPLLVFELLGFLADPEAPIDPNGHIANLMYAELYHARITLPPPVVAMFPALGKVLNIDYSGKINVATVIALGQSIQSIAETLISKVESNSQQALTWIEELIQDPPQANVSNILALLPVEMRVVHLQGRLVNFDADATFLLTFGKDISQQLGGPQIPIPAPAEAFELVYQNDFSEADLSEWQSYNFGLKRGDGHWSVVAGELIQDNNVGDNSPARYGAMLVYEKVELTDFRLSLLARSLDNDGLGVVFHFQSQDTFYRFRMTKEQKQWRLDKLIKGDIDTLFSTNSSFTENQFYKIKIEASSSDQNRRSLGLIKDSSFRKKRNASTVFILNTPAIEAIQTRIKVWVNGQLWCDVIDDSRPLTSGKFGLDSWWNNGAHFDSIKLFKQTDNDITINSKISPQQLGSLNQRLAKPESELADYLNEFSSEDISAALSEVDEFAITMTARVKAFEQTLLSMLGSISSDGRFSLMSTAHVGPFSLSVAGVKLAIPFQVQGRISLVGYQAGANSYAKLRASVSADYVVLPGPTPEQSIARLILGSEQIPVSLTMDSNVDFAVTGAGELRLFSEQVILTGDLDIDQNHIMVSGQLVFSPEVQIDGHKIVEFTAVAQGRIGPNDFIELLGAGQLSLFNNPLVASNIKVSKQLIELNLSMGASAHGNSWHIDGLSIENPQMTLSGKIDFSYPATMLAFKGKGHFDLFGAHIDGIIQFDLQGNNYLLEAQGSLSWLGRDWLAGRIMLSNTGVELQGRADFALPITASQLGSGLQIAGLFLNAAVSGKFKLNNMGQLIQWQLMIDWQLAVKLPNVNHSKQCLPIASQQMKVSGSHSGSDSIVHIAELINFDGITLFDLQGLTIPIPQFDSNQNYQVYLHESVDLGIDPIDFSYPIFDLNPLDGFEEGSVSIQIPEIPIPILSNEPQNLGDEPIFEVPKLSITSAPLGQFRLNDQFNLKLAWQAGQLGIVTTIDAATHFYPFEELPTQLHTTVGSTFTISDLQ